MNEKRYHVKEVSLEKREVTIVSPLNIFRLKIAEVDERWQVMPLENVYFHRDLWHRLCREVLYKWHRLLEAAEPSEVA